MILSRLKIKAFFFRLGLTGYRLNKLNTIVGNARAAAAQPAIPLDK